DTIARDAIDQGDDLVFPRRQHPRRLAERAAEVRLRQVGPAIRLHVADEPTERGAAVVPRRAAQTQRDLGRPVTAEPVPQPTPRVWQTEAVLELDTQVVPEDFLLLGREGVAQPEPLACPPQRAV